MTMGPGNEEVEPPELAAAAGEAQQPPSLLRRRRHQPPHPPCARPRRRAPGPRSRHDRVSSGRPPRPHAVPAIPGREGICCIRATTRILAPATGFYPIAALHLPRDVAAIVPGTLIDRGTSNSRPLPSRGREARPTPRITHGRTTQQPHDGAGSGAHVHGQQRPLAWIPLHRCPGGSPRRAGRKHGMRHGPRHREAEGHSQGLRPGAASHAAPRRSETGRTRPAWRGDRLTGTQVRRAPRTDRGSFPCVARPKARAAGGPPPGERREDHRLQRRRPRQGAPAARDRRVAASFEGHGESQQTSMPEGARGPRVHLVERSSLHAFQHAAGSGPHGPDLQSPPPATAGTIDGSRPPPPTSRHAG